MLHDGHPQPDPHLHKLPQHCPLFEDEAKLAEAPEDSLFDEKVDPQHEFD